MSLLLLAAQKKLKSTSFTHHRMQIICHLNTFPNIFKSWVITSSYHFLHHFVLLTHVFFNETSDVTMTEQMVIYASFNYQGIIKEHYLGTITVKLLYKLVGTELSIPNIMKALGKYFDEINIPISQLVFPACIIPM